MDLLHLSEERNYVVFVIYLIVLQVQRLELRKLEKLLAALGIWSRFFRFTRPSRPSTFWIMLQERLIVTKFVRVLRPSICLMAF
jgi:hypothetical protein